MVNVMHSWRHSKMQLLWAGVSAYQHMVIRYGTGESYRPKVLTAIFAFHSNGNVWDLDLQMMEYAFWIYTTPSYRTLQVVS